MNTTPNPTGAIERLIKWADSLNCESDFQPVIDTSKAELASLREQNASLRAELGHSKYLNHPYDPIARATTKLAAERDSLREQVERLEKEDANVQAVLSQLTESVNRCRYRGVRRDKPMTDRYHWPMSFDELERIAQAALRYVLAASNKAALSSPSLEPGRMK